MAVRQLGNSERGEWAAPPSRLAVAAATVGGLGAVVFLLEAARGVMRVWSNPSADILAVSAVFVASMIALALVASAGVWLVSSGKTVGAVILLVEGVIGLGVMVYFVIVPVWGAPFVLIAGIVALIANRRAGTTPA